MSETPWFKVDDGFHGHPKVVDLTLDAIGLWTVAGSWCAKYLTDGHIPARTLARLGGERAQANELVDAGLWETAEGGWQFKDWADYQPLKEAVEAERRAAQERMAKVRAAKKGVNTTRSPEPKPNVQANEGPGSPEVRIAPSQSQSLSHPSTTSNTPKRKPETPLPATWQPSTPHRQFASSNGIDVEHEAEQFRAHAAANDRRQRDWDAAFRSWLGNAKKWARPAAPVAPRRRQFGPTPEERAAAVIALGMEGEHE